MTTTAKVDNKKRVLIPDAKPGQLLVIQSALKSDWTVTPVKKAKEKFPPASLLKYMISERDKEEAEIFKGAVKGPR